MRLRFNQLPEADILMFLRKICMNENIIIDDEKLIFIQKMYKSDIRSMINYIQSNKDIILNLKVLNVSVWLELTSLFKIKNNHINIIHYFENLCDKYNIDIVHVIKDYLMYIIVEQTSCINKQLIEFIESIMHLTDINCCYFKTYTALTLNALISNN